MATYDANEYEHRRDETPMAKMARLELELEQAYHRQIVKLHNSLPARSSDIQLFSFAECRQWNLRKNARRSLPANEDGA
jgi:hypothetical protein